MVNKILVTEMDGTPEQISFADYAGDFSPNALNNLQFSTPTTCQLSLASVADTTARQSTKVDLGANRAQAYKVRAAFELNAPTASDLIELYWSPSPSVTGTYANAANVVGSDSAYAGYSSNLAASVLQLDLIGVFVCTAQVTGTVQVAEVGLFIPTERYGSLIIKNESNSAFATDDVESHIVFDPIVPELQ